VTATTPPVPDLTRVDLRDLRAMRRGELAAAVDDVLTDPRRLVEIWWGGETKDG
jgi:hypothetical protein